MTSSWWVFIPDPEPERVQKIYSEAMGYGRIGLTFGEYMRDLTTYRYDNELLAFEFSEGTGNTWEPSVKSFVRMFRNVLDGVAVGDLVLYPSTQVDEMLNIGRVTSGYRFNPNTEFKHIRDVKWLAKYSRESFPATLLKKYPRSLAVSTMKNDNEFVCALMTRLRADGILK